MSRPSVRLSFRSESVKVRGRKLRCGRRRGHWHWQTYAPDSGYERETCAATGWFSWRPLPRAVRSPVQ